MKNLQTNKLVLLIVFLCLCGSIHAQTIDRDELQRGQGTVEFQNFTGPVTQFNTRAQIRGIGYDLGVAVRNGATQSGQTARYFVIHSVTDPEGNKLDADIFGLGSAAGVDHIRNLRFIIQGYLEAAYGYSEQDASLLAEYITIYNAVYRGNWEHYQETFKTAVMQHLTYDRVGLSTHYSEWPGRSLIVIPLRTGIASGIGAIDTSELSDPKVIEELMKEDDGLDQRLDMADLQEREAEAAEEEAERIRQEIAEEESRLAAEREYLEQERERLEQERAYLTDQEVAQREAELALVEQGLAEREEALAEDREAAQELEDFAQQMRAEAEEERRAVAEAQDGGRDGGTESPPQVAQRDDDDDADDDQIGFIVSEDGNALGIVGMAMTGQASPMGYFVRINPATGDVIQRSTVNNINIRTVMFMGNRAIALAGTGTIRLVTIDTETLEQINESIEAITPESLLWVRGNNIYVIISVAGSRYLGRFDTNLTLLAQTEVPLHQFAGVAFQGEMMLLTQRANGQALVLDPMTLREE